MNISTRFSRQLRSGIIIIALGLAVALSWSAVQRPDSTLEIRATQEGASSPDGFFVWHHLDANGIPFKSITSRGNGLVITFNSSAQSDAAREVLHRTLPQGYIIAQQKDDNIAQSLFSRLRRSPPSLG